MTLDRENCYKFMENIIIYHDKIWCYPTCWDIHMWFCPDGSHLSTEVAQMVKGCCWAKRAQGLHVFAEELEGTYYEIFWNIVVVAEDAHYFFCFTFLVYEHSQDFAGHFFKPHLLVHLSLWILCQGLLLITGFEWGPIVMMACGNDSASLTNELLWF